MRYFIDTEFMDDGPYEPVRLLSIGIVAQDGREFYAETQAERSLANDWVKEHVLPQMKGPVLARDTLRARVLDFVGDDSLPEFWGYFADYDWVLFCGIFGRMIDLPRGWPMFCHDLMQATRIQKSQWPVQNGNEHHALADARWTKEVFDFLAAPGRIALGIY